MSFPSITNRGEFFSNHYLDAVIGGDLGAIRSRWDDAEEHDKPTPRSRLRGLPKAFFDARAAVADAGDSSRAAAVRAMHDVVLEALGYTVERSKSSFTRATVDTLRASTACRVETPIGFHLVAIEGGMADEVDDLFATEVGGAGLLLDPFEREGDTTEVISVAVGINEFFALDEPPRFVLALGGSVLLLAERSKWAEGRYLAVDLDGALERRDTKAKGELETIAALFSADALVPDDGQSVIDELVDNSHKHAVGVSKELRNGIRESIELLANEVIEQRLELSQRRHDRRLSSADAGDLTKQCLRYLYRLLVLLYAESRPELGILPANDPDYDDGYSLDRLRELVLVELETDAARNGSHFHQSLTLLFELVNNGYNADQAELQFVFDTPEEGERSHEKHLTFPGLDAVLFDPESTKLLDEVTLRNEVLQRVLSLLMLSPEGRGKRKRADRGFISYAQLGINQLGAVYEGLMSYTGFFADDDLYEVAKNGDPSDGTWVLPVKDADEYPPEVFVMRVDELTGKEERVLHRKGGFVFRLSGRDRQRSASYYTPEVLTQCVVKHALAELLGTDDYAPENGSSGIQEGEAVKILDLTICEPALGSGAFANEAINQLSAEYLKRRQAERKETLDPERYLKELQKVKAHFALHQTYGVDLNSTAIELAEVSLWLNAMYPGLKAPWFGLQLRRGNSLIGCRRATWKASLLRDRPWAQTKKGSVIPPTDRPLTDPIEPDEIHHFLLPAHGWAAVADRKEAKELRPDEVESLKAWRKAILKAPSPNDAKRLKALAAGVEAMWAQAAQRIRLTQAGLRRSIDVYGAPFAGSPISRAEAQRVLNQPDSPLGRLRTVMDAWIGLWFWPLDTGVRPPSWSEWLDVLEQLVDVDDRAGMTGQLDLFSDLAELMAADERADDGRSSVAEITEAHPWLGRAVDVATAEGAWHWELEFAPVFDDAGGFDLQVGNPPWVRPRWLEDLVLAESDPWWGVTEKPSATAQRSRRTLTLDESAAQNLYLGELSSSEGTVEILGSPVERPLLAGVQTNLYMVFMEQSWRHLSRRGVAGLLHPESHFTDPKGESIRRAAYRTLRRHWQLINALFLFEEIHHMTVYGVHIYGSETTQPDFLQASYLFHPDMVDQSMVHDGTGDLPGIQYESGGWDLRPHKARLTRITQDVLADWAKLFDEPETPASEARLLRPVTTADLEALSVLAAQPVRLAARGYDWSWGHEEHRARAAGIIENRTARHPRWSPEVILQGAHISNGCLLANDPNQNCKHNQDYAAIDLEHLPEHFVPRTNFWPSTPEYASHVTSWNGSSSTERARVMWRAMTQSGAMRSMHCVLAPPGPFHTGSIFSLALEDDLETVLLSGLWSSIPIDYIVKVSGTANVKENLVRRLPAVEPGHPAAAPLALRTLRLNALIADYSSVWESQFDPLWLNDSWTSNNSTHAINDIEPEWSAETPLRGDADRRRAFVEIDALAAAILGLRAEQLCSMYRTQFPVLRKYEYSTVFDSHGRGICKYHQASGRRQFELQERAKAGDLPQEWNAVWKLYERYEQDPDSVDWLGFYTPPFTRPDREAEMTRAYNEFQRRLESGEYDHQEA